MVVTYHPAIEQLRGDHTVILARMDQVLGLLDEIYKDHSGRNWDSYTLRLSRMGKELVAAMNRHHERERCLLTPLCLYAEGQEAAELLERNYRPMLLGLEALLTAPTLTANELQIRGRGLIELTRTHIAQEEECVFSMAQRYLCRPVLDKAAQEMAGVA